jgi:uncharacterized protein (DUF1697 family)
VTSWVALLRAVNVGGTGKLAMSELTRLCEEAGFRSVRTYIASGNVVFSGDDDEATVRETLERSLERHAGRPVGVLVRSAAEMAGVVRRNPFADRAGNRTVALFVDGALHLDGLKHQAGEELRLGEREIYVFYGDGMATSRLQVPAAKAGTARNMNTVARLAEMAGAG